ncbi:MAG TPA: hypothetical protein VGO80_23470 [Solirubrobacteraceae bacterium]|nr:hypothetical protein [Solirubrobacteraceae bacterium]
MFPASDTLVARLTTPAGRPTLRGSLRYSVPLRRAGRASLRLSVAAGAAYVRRAAALHALLRVGTITGIGVASVRLRIRRHRW